MKPYDDVDMPQITHLVRPASTMTLSDGKYEHTVDSRMSPLYEELVKVGTRRVKAADTVMCYGLALLESVAPLNVYTTLSSIISYAEVKTLDDCDRIHETVLRIAKGIQADVERVKP